MRNLDDELLSQNNNMYTEHPDEDKALNEDDLNFLDKQITPAPEVRHRPGTD